MNRSIKFRGYNEMAGWVYGDLRHGVVSREGKTYILPRKVNMNMPGCHPLDGYEVHPDSVGQYTGLKDKNDQEIYEGDILYTIAEERFKVKYNYKAGVVEFLDDLQWQLKSDNALNLMPITWGGFESIEIIGNTFQTPELLNP